MTLMDLHQMSTASKWMHEHVWPEIEAMMWNDAHLDWWTVQGS